MRDRGVFVVRRDRSGEREVSVEPFAGEPDWHPDGTAIVYSVFGEGLFIQESDGSGSPRQITNSPLDADPAWHATGEITFTRVDRAAENSTLYLLRLRDQVAVPLLDDSRRDQDAAWSESDALAFIRTGDDVADVQGRELFIMRDGTVSRITTNEVLEMDPAWRPGM